MTAAERQARTRAADVLCHTAYDDMGGPATGVALVAVGGYGRAELAPFSDLDVVLVHDDAVDPGALAEQVWYPLWDSGARIDHAVRSVGSALSAADADLRVALGLLDARFIAGDPNLVLRLRTTMLAQWRRRARSRLPELHRMVQHRHGRAGELAHIAVPDLKESQGGLRDATLVKALVATWLVDAPHVELERSRQSLLDVRDTVHGLAGRGNDRITPEAWVALPDLLGVDDVVAAQVHVRELGRRITHISRMTWRRVDEVLARPAAVGARRPALRPIARGVALAKGEVVLDRTARPARDPLLLLRAASEAAERGAVLAPATAARLVRESPRLPEPWPDEARRLLVRLLAAGRGLLGVWETLEQTGGLDLLLPEWERIRSLPHASPIHRFTVDRHVVETCIEAAALIRGVARPDVLLVAALLHDIGKGGMLEHGAAGEPIAHAVATRMGFTEDDAGVVAALVRWHLLLVETATTRDPDDPATVDLLTSRIGSTRVLALLVALTEADARATSPKAWSAWRAGLVRRLARRCEEALVAGESSGRDAEDPEQVVALPPEVVAGTQAVSVEVLPRSDGARVRVASVDRIGLLADAAAMLALERTSVRAARAWQQDGYGVSEWEVADQHLDAAVMRQRMNAIVEGRIDVAERLAGRFERRDPSGVAGLAPSVVVRPEASRRATVLEVRAADRPSVMHRVCAVLAELEVSVVSAHLDTVGPQVVDVFYLQEVGAVGALSDDRAAAAAHAVRSGLTG